MLRYLFAIFCLFVLTACIHMNSDNKSPLPMSLTFSKFEQKIAQKISIDIRYFCPDELNQNLGMTIKPKLCLQPVTELPTELSQMIKDTSIGGIVLFAQNLASNEQTVKLTNDLQKAALESNAGKPLIISIDQEGGRVVRLANATAFAGNMAIGATYAKHGIKFAYQTGKVIAQELQALGINNNYAPVVDVNTNANNPVINTRSFGENPIEVARLGVAVVDALQQQNVMATLKHFPGHGDTHVDSHVGLPRVDHDLQVIEKYDLAPFKWAIEHSNPAMIMTAHIQYPALDNSTFVNKEGIDTIRPATMSRKILTDLLRIKMGYKGIIATDALDMAGISQYFDAVSATVETFKAGADLALMPYRIRNVSDINKFKRFIKSVSKMMQEQIEQGTFDENEIDQSLTRLNDAKAKYISLSKFSLNKRIDDANKLIAHKNALLLEQELANNAVTLIKNSLAVIPFSVDKIKVLHLLVANQQEFLALQKAINKQWKIMGLSQQLVIHAIIVDEALDALAQIQNIEQLKKADLVISTIDVKLSSAVDLGGVEDLLMQAVNQKSEVHNIDEKIKIKYGQLLALQLTLANQYKIKTVLIAKSSPYLIGSYSKLADAVLLTFDDRIYKNSDNEYVSPGFNTSIAILVGNQKAKGVLPVTLN